MTDRALNTYRAQTPLVIKKACHSHNRIKLEQSKRVRRIVQVHFAETNFLNKISRQSIHINLQSEIKRSFRTQANAYASELLAFNRLVQLECVTPKCFITESIKTKCSPAFQDHLRGAL